MMKGRTIPLSSYSLNSDQFPIYNHRGSPSPNASSGINAFAFAHVAPSEWYSCNTGHYAHVGPSFGGTFSNTTSGWSRHHGVNNQTLSHIPSTLDIAQLNGYRGLMLSNGVREDYNNNSVSRKPMLNPELISQCEARALQSKQQAPPLPSRPFQAQTTRFSMAHAKSVQQPMHDILISYFNYKAASKSQREFLDHLHWTACLQGGICKCENHRLLVLHFDSCRDSCCSICGPVRLVCCPGKHYRDYVVPEIQPTCKRMKMEDTAQNDEWSLYAITGQSLKKQQSSEKAGSENPVSHSEGNSGVVEVESYGEGSNYDDIWDLIESDCGQPALNKEVPSSSANTGESLLLNDFVLDDETLPNEINASRCEEIGTGVEMQEMGCVATCQVKGCDESLNSDDRCDTDKSDQSSLDKETPRSMGNIEEILLSSSCAFDDMNMGNEELDKFVEELETECVDTDRVESCDQSLNLSDNKRNTPAKSDCQPETDSEDLKVSGVSLIDFFTPEQIKEHLHSLNQRTPLTSETGLAGNVYMRTVDENTCQLCDVGGRMFAPPLMYCTCCGAQIKPRVAYYRPPEDGTTSVKHSFCTKCFRVSRGSKGTISFRGLSFPKANLEKCKHDDEVPEGWVQCDKCKGWQHQICALYNCKKDLGGDSEYFCPFCQLIEIEEKGRSSLPPAFGARDLPRTKLSDHIEERLFRSLKEERKRRAEELGKSPEEVPGAEDLVVRVVLDVNNSLKVKQEFLDILQGETYPTDFPYKSKVLLLFQKFEGVDVCIFAMYLQEFGSECGHPNNRSIYISYLDSVKHFRPEVKTVDGVALRTFVYQEILIGYLDYCKQRGFATCYIWACPPIKGEDYILYCHPETQKTPNPHKLLQWYKKMLRKAKEESVVLEYTNFYEYFFVPSRECNSKITTARLPQFDGDYWSFAIGNMIRTVDKETEEVSKKKVKTKTTKRAMGHTQPSGDEAKDMLVMQKLGQVILPSKEEFFVIHLHFACVNCHEPILSGSRLSCNQCSKFHLCHRCIELGRTHTSIHGERHQLFETRVTDVAADTEDGDIVLDNDLFNNRLSFLMLCQENHYQFDTLRCAKHSSMMILHHLQTKHNTTAV